MMTYKSSIRLLAVFLILSGFVSTANSIQPDTRQNGTLTSSTITIIFPRPKDPDFELMPGLEMAVENAASGYKPGLELREQVDQLLLFPLLMQEMMSTSTLTALPLAQTSIPEKILTSLQDSNRAIVSALLENIKASRQPIIVDAIIEQRSQYIARSTTLYVRYWISSDRFYTQVLWSEPNYGSSVFAIYPRSLTISDAGDEFKIEHAIFNRKYNFPKDNKIRPDFSYPFYNYPIRDIRYFPNEYRQTSTTLAALDKTHISHSVPGHNAVTSDSKTNTYVFTNGQLKEMIVDVPETSVMVGGASKIKYSQGNMKGQLSRWPAVFREGGRRFDIHFRNVEIDDKDFALPDAIHVSNASSGTWMQRIRLLDYQAVNQTAWENVVISGISTANFNSPEEKKWRSLRNAMWDLNPTSLTQERKLDVVNFRESFKRNLRIDHLHPFDRIRLRDQLAWLGVVPLCSNPSRADVSRGVKEFDLYMEEFAAQENPTSAIQAGRSLLEYISSRSTLTPAIKSKYVDEWANNILKANDPAELSLFNIDLVNSGENWLALYLFVRMNNTNIQLTAIEKALLNIQAEAKSSKASQPNISTILVQNKMTDKICEQLAKVLRHSIDRSPNKENKELAQRILKLLDNRKTNLASSSTALRARQ